MIRRLFRLIVLSGLVAAATKAYKALKRSDDPLPTPATTPSAPWPPLQPVATTAPTPVDAATTEPAAAPTAKATPVPTAQPAVGGEAWADPTAGGECPDGYPIKAKLKSKIFHAPGQLNYDRTTPDRCYRDDAAAVADGLRAAKR